VSPDLAHRSAEQLAPTFLNRQSMSLLRLLCLRKSCANVSVLKGSAGNIAAAAPRGRSAVFVVAISLAYFIE
jgi:hypothetical protein